MVIDEHAVGVGFEAMAEQRRPGQLAHQRMGELIEGIGQDDDFVILTQLVEKARAPGSGPISLMTF